MKKVISAILACVFVFAMAATAFAASSPIAPTINTTRPTTAPSSVEPTQEPTSKDDVAGDDKTTKPTTELSTSDSTTDKGDVDDTTTGIDESTTKDDVTSDKQPVSPDTGSYVGKTVSAAALVALVLGGAAVYTSKKKVTE